MTISPDELRKSLSWWGRHSAAMLGLAACGTANTGDTGSARFSQIFGPLQDLAAFYRQPESERDKVDIQLPLTATDESVRPLRVWIDMPGRPIEVPVREDGTFELPLDPEIIKADPFIRTNQPKRTLKFHLRVILKGVTLPSAAESFMPAVEQGERMKKKYSGVPAFLVPDATDLIFSFGEDAPDCVLTQRMENGDVAQVARDRHGKSILPIKTIKANPTMRLESNCKLSSVISDNL